MNGTIINPEDFEDKPSNVLPFIRRLTGGSGTSGGTGTNWLRDIPQGTRFLARRKGYTGAELEDFVVATDPKTMEVVLLAKNVGGAGVFCWYETEVFSKDYRWIFTLEVMDNVNDKHIHSGSVGSTEEPEVLLAHDED